MSLDQKPSRRRFELSRFRTVVAALVLSFCTVWASAGVGLADVGGQIPGPELCPYPFVGVTGMVQPGVGQAVWQACRSPIQPNGSYYITGYGLYSSTGNMTGSLIGISLAAGGGGGISGYFCLDDPYHPTVFMPAPDPNPPSTFDRELHPPPCVPLSGVPVVVPGFNGAPTPDTQPPPNPFAPQPEPPQPEPAPAPAVP